MGSITNAAHAAALDYLLGSTGFTATVNVRLCTTAPTQSANGTEVSTGTWTNYARVPMTNNATNWPAASSANPSLKSNGVAIDFGTAATGANVTLEGFEIWNADNSVRIAWGTLASQVVQNGNPVSFAIGALDVTAQPLP